MAGVPDNGDAIAALVHKRCKAAAALARVFPEIAREAAIFIDAHFPLYSAATAGRAVTVDLYPELQEPLAETMRVVWGGAVFSAITDGVNPPQTAVGRVLQKGGPGVGSVRYISSQLAAACTASSDRVPEKQVLRDMLRCCALETWAPRPGLSFSARYMAWSETPAQQYERLGERLKSSDVQFCITAFLRGIADMDIGSAYVLRHQRTFPHIATLRALGRAAHGDKGGVPVWPRQGFAINHPAAGKIIGELRSGPGAAPSAKRVKAVYQKYKNPSLTAAIRSQFHPAVALAGAPLEAAEAARQQAMLTPTFVLVCTNCGVCCTRPVNGGQRSRGRASAALPSVLIDLNSAAVSCAVCKSDQVFRVPMNGYQLKIKEGWARLCSACGVFGAKHILHGAGALCARCFGLKARTSI